MVDTKGGRIPFLFKNIYITSNLHPKEWYQSKSLDELKALARRIKGKCKEYL